MTCASGVLPKRAKLTEADYRNLSGQSVLRLVNLHGKDRLALEAGCSERTVRLARDRETKLDAQTLFNMLTLDPSALDELLAHFGLHAVPINASDEADGRLLADTARLAAEMAGALADGQIDHREEQALAKLARPVATQWAARVAVADRKRA